MEFKFGGHILHLVQSDSSKFSEIWVKSEVRREFLTPTNKGWDDSRPLRLQAHIPDMDTATSTADDNPFAGPKAQPAGKVWVNMPTDEWLCKKMSKLNITLVEGYPSHSSEAGLLKDQFVHPGKSLAK